MTRKTHRHCERTRSNPSPCLFGKLGCFVALLLAMTFCAPANATPLVADLSNYQITMDSNFNGTRIFVFGARADTGDVVIAVRGPRKNYMLRKKREVAGIWVNAERMKFYGIPDYYALASSKPLSELSHQHLLQQLAIGDNNLFSRTGATGENDFITAFTANQHKRGLYRGESAPLTFMGETLFKTAIDFPDNIPPGMYNAEIYLLRDNAIVGTQVLPIEVHKVGLDAFLYNYAHHQPFLYGITAVLMALGAGWFAGRLFEKI